MEENLEKNSRTLREKRRGSVEQFAAVLAALVGIGSVASGMHHVAQIIIFSVIGLIAIASYVRFARIGRYRREDHRCGKVVKPEDV